MNRCSFHQEAQRRQYRNSKLEKGYRNSKQQRTLLLAPSSSHHSHHESLATSSMQYSLATSSGPEETTKTSYREPSDQFGCHKMQRNLEKPRNHTASKQVPATNSTIRHVNSEEKRSTYLHKGVILRNYTQWNHASMNCDAGNDEATWQSAIDAQ